MNKFSVQQMAKLHRAPAAKAPGLRRRRTQAGPGFLLSLIISWGVLSSASVYGQSYIESPFWQTSAGWWQTTNTYVDADFNYRIREYHSLLHIALDLSLIHI